MTYKSGEPASTAGKTVDPIRIAPLLLASFLEQQQCDDKEKQQLQPEQVLKSDAQAKTQSPSNDEPSAKRSRSAAGGSDF